MKTTLHSFLPVAYLFTAFSLGLPADQPVGKDRLPNQLRSKSSMQNEGAPSILAVPPPGEGPSSANPSALSYKNAPQIGAGIEIPLEGSSSPLDESTPSEKSQERRQFTKR